MITSKLEFPAKKNQLLHQDRANFSDRRSVLSNVTVHRVHQYPEVSGEDDCRLIPIRCALSEPDQAAVRKYAVADFNADLVVDGRRHANIS